ncbi:hypothetical protein [Bacillus sp. USDA818B3_A]|uniref:hypothetical protein n=1 Tax=Bacillus sp. USDA818B3_A TaxID=2698834 RepID=UPI001370D844|nr:hypothetical protein [Bacillus sp. USDA818B3_A]
MTKKIIDRIPLEERIKVMTNEENQGGDLSARDYAWYVTLGIIFPVILLIWGWS